MSTERKIKAEEAPEGEAPAKAQKTAADEVPETRLRAEVQSLLVGVSDLANTTVGQIRGSLEERLGLESGALVAKRRLRRQLSRVMQDEVMKKTNRSEKCARIVKALIEFEEYPAATRQMLIDSLPHATAPVAERGPPHEHQVRLLSIVSDAIRDARDRSAVAQAEQEVKAESEQASLREREAAQACAVDTEAAARVGADEAAARARDLAEEVAKADAALKSAEAAVREAGQKAAKARQDGQIAAALRDGPLTTLRSGGCEGKEKENAVSALLVYLEETDSEGSLISAAPNALRMQPEERSMFDKLTVDCIVECLEDRIRKGDHELTVREEFQTDAERLAASAMLGAISASAAEQNQALSDANAAVQAAEAATLAAQAALSRQRKTVRACCEERDAAVAKRQELDQVLDIVDQLMTGPGPAAKEADASAEANAEATTEEAAEVAEVEAEAAAEATQEAPIEAQGAVEGQESAGEANASEEASTEEAADADEPQPKEEVLEPQAMDCTLPVKSDYAAASPKVPEAEPIFSPRRVPTPMKRGAELGV